MFKEFLIKDLFEVISNPQLDKSEFTFSKKSEYPYFTRTENNNGILGYVDYLDDEHLIKGNSLAVGMISMKFHYMAHDFYAGQFTKTLFPKFNNFNEKIALYFIAILNKSSKLYSSFLVRHFADKVKNSVVNLPVRASSIPNYNYTVNDIDWQYMEERITELEQERITELDAYLKVTGLNDYELTEDDKETLSLSAKSTSNKTDGLGIDSKNGKVIFKEFRVIDVFDVRNTKNFMQSQIKLGSGHVPYLTASETNNSVASYISCDKAWLERGNCIFIGGKTLTITYQEQDFVSNDSHNLALYLKNDSVKTRYIHEYLITSLKKSLAHKYFWGDSISFKKIQSDTIKLPVDRFGEINFDYMERYIKAIEKLTIAEVVKYKDKVISATKQLVLNN